MFVDVQNVLIYRDEKDRYCLAVNNPHKKCDGLFFHATIIDTDIDELKPLIGKETVLVCDLFSYFDYIYVE